MNRTDHTDLDGPLDLDEDGMPAAIRALPRDRHHRPVPWFVDKCNGVARADFRIVPRGAPVVAVHQQICFTCGQLLPGFRTGTFVIGPMCAVNRISAEPPHHLDCALWSAKNCPFLSRPTMRRRDAGMPDAAQSPGVMLTRNPGVVLLWTTGFYQLELDAGKGLLFAIGEPQQVDWLREGRPATRQEVLDAMAAGLPALTALAENDADLADVRARYEAALALVPA